MKDFLVLTAFGTSLIAAILYIFHQCGFRVTFYFIPPSDFDQLIRECGL